MPDPYSGPIDAQFAVLVILLGLAMFFLLAPVPGKPQRPGTPTDDTTKTRRLP